MVYSSSDESVYTLKRNLGEQKVEGIISRSSIQNLAGLFTSTGEVDLDLTCKFLEVSRAELARGFNLDAELLRPERMSNLVKDRIKELGAAIEIVAEEYAGDIDKTKFWFNAPNRNFGGISPKKLILNGRAKKVFKFLRATQEGY